MEIVKALLLIPRVTTQQVQHAPVAVAIDEMGAFLLSREADSLSVIHHTEVISEFLRRIPEMAMTNRIDKIDRPSSAGQSVPILYY